jgi:hemerythrin-like domain-containing protein
VSENSRRDFFKRSLPLVLAASPWAANPPAVALAIPEPQGETISATENLMKEHGVIRRCFLVYAAVAARLDRHQDLRLSTLGQAAGLMRLFGEQFHEQSEESGVFPVLKKANRLTDLVDILVAQHRRGRELTQYFIGVSKADSLSSIQRTALSTHLWSFGRMYAQHVAREDTEVFPALRQLLTPKQLADLGNQFADAERRVLGKDGFEHGLERIEEIERELDLGNLARFTAPAPPDFPLPAGGARKQPV